MEGLSVALGAQELVVSGDGFILEVGVRIEPSRIEQLHFDARVLIGGVV